jgi:uracil-DNA glycosylase
MPLAFEIPKAWQPVLSDEIEKPYFTELRAFVERERAAHTVYPPHEDVFNALVLTPYKQVKVLILGQDPYHNENQAHGLAFSVRPGVPPPPSLLNIFKELQTDVGARIPNNGLLVHWTRQGVMLLNVVLTVRSHQPGSHQGKGWEIFTDQIIRALSAREDPVIFVLWGNFAKKKLGLIDEKRNPVISGPHPSPLSAKRGFFGSRPFSKINQHLKEMGKDEIDWQLPDL